MQKNPTLAQLKKEIQTLPAEKIIALITKLGKFNALNKQLITYELFDAETPETYISDLKVEINDALNLIKLDSWYNQKKTFKKFMKTIGNYKKIMANNEMELQMHLAIATKIYHILTHEKYDINFIIEAQLFKSIALIKKLIDTLHQDLQYDYLKQYKKLVNH